MAWWVLVAAPAAAEEVPGEREPLPDPLTLETVLRLAEEPHPDLDAQLARVEHARSGVLAARSRYGSELTVDLDPRLSDFAAEPGHDFVNDSRARLLFSKRLYDFGRTRALTEAAGANLAGQEHRLYDVRQQRRLEVMARFLDVLLADLRYLADDEEMSRRYVNYDKARERHELGMVSETDLLELETFYREALNVRTDSGTKQHLTRVSLALALNRPTEVPANLTRPGFDDLERETPDYEATIQQALVANPQLLVLKEVRAAAQRTVEAERALRRPTLSTEFEATALEKKIGSRESGRLDVLLRVPLYQGGVDRAAIGAAEARLAEAEAQYRRFEIALRREVLETLHELDSLRVARNTARVRENYRDAAVDRARGFYELELDTTLGESMARLTEAQYLRAKTEFETALAWARLEALLGRFTSPQIAGVAP